MNTLPPTWNPAKQRLLADGAWGTELMKRGLKTGEAPERLNIEAPDIVAAVAKDYLAAGSDIILTNSFGASVFQLERHGLAERVVEINEIAARLSKREAERAPRGALGSRLVAGSIGPSGKLLITGEVTPDRLYDGFLQQAKALVAGGADWLLIESMSDVEEMVVAVRAAREAGDVPVVSSMVYDSVRSGGYRTIMGNTPEQCAERALEAGASIVGANCGTGIENYLDLARTLCRMRLAPVWIKPNRGLPEVENHATVYRQNADEFASFTAQLLEAGVAVVGGCCGATPAFIAAIRPLVDSHNARAEGESGS